MLKRTHAIKNQNSERNGKERNLGVQSMKVLNPRHPLRRCQPTLSPRHQSRGSNHTSSRLGHHLQRRPLLQDREEGGIRGGGRRAGRGVPPHLPSTCTHSLPPRFNTPDPDPPDGIAGYCCDSRCLPYHKPAAPATGGVGERGGAAWR
jgi:hypothetical protein